MSTYSLPSTSYTFEPAPWLSQTACGAAICQLEVAPPASTSRPRCTSSRLRGWRGRKARSSAAITSSPLPVELVEGTSLTTGETTGGQPLNQNLRAQVDWPFRLCDGRVADNPPRCCRGGARCRFLTTLNDAPDRFRAARADVSS